MTDDLDLSVVHGRHEPDRGFRLDLRRQVEAIVRAPADQTSSTYPAGASDLAEEDLIMLETQDRSTRPGPTPPHRPSPSRWLLGAAAAVLLGILATVLVFAADDDDKIDTADTTPTSTPARNMLEVQENGPAELERGSYYIDPDGDDATSLRVFYQITSQEGWAPWIGAVKNQDPAGGQSSFSITTVTNLVTDGCESQYALTPAVGPAVDDLATALSQLEPFEVVEPATDVQRFGYSGKHLTLTVPADLAVTGETDDDRRFQTCDEGELRSWISPLLGGPFWGYNGLAGTTEEFLILDVEGTRLVLVKLTSPDTPAKDIAERDAIFDSISIEP